MYATLIVDTGTHATELTTHDDVNVAMATIDSAATWMDPTQKTRLLRSPEEGAGEWEILGETESYYGAEQRDRLIASGQHRGKFTRRLLGRGPHHLGERGFVFTADAELLDLLVATT